MVAILSAEGRGVAQGQSIDQGYIRHHNIERVLAALEAHQPVSRTELARITEMSSASVTRIVSALSRLGLVREASLTGHGGRGRKAINLCTVPDGMFTVGFHVDLKSLGLCLLDFGRNARADAEMPLEPRDLTPERLAAAAQRQFRRLPKADAARVRWAGVSLSGRVDGETGRVAASKALGWTDVDLAAPLSDALGLPVVVENDVRACLTWESARRGLPAKGEDAAYLYLGRMGIGFANTAGGTLVRGQSNAAGEIEDIRLGLDERLSAHLMEESLVARARKLAPSVRGMGDIIEAMRMELPWARVLMDDFFSHLNIVVQLVRALLDPHAIILGGDIPDALRAGGLLPDEPGCLAGERFEESCARGAAAIAMQRALDDLINGAMDA